MFSLVRIVGINVFHQLRRWTADLKVVKWKVWYTGQAIFIRIVIQVAVPHYSRGGEDIYNDYKVLVFKVTKERFELVPDYDPRGILQEVEGQYE